MKDAVYLLAGPSNPAADIVFFHGLQPFRDYSRAHTETCVVTPKGASSFCWPTVFLAEDFPRARVLSVSYASCATKWHRGGDQMLKQFGQELAKWLEGRTVGVGTRPVVFIGHSLGGLVLKQVCEEWRTDRNKDALVSSIKGMLFYGTPHGGATWADAAVNIGAANADILECLLAFDPTTASLHENFLGLCEQQRWKPLSLVEKWATAKVGEGHTGFHWSESVSCVEAGGDGLCGPCRWGLVSVWSRKGLRWEACLVKRSRQTTSPSASPRRSRTRPTWRSRSTSRRICRRLVGSR